MNSHLKILSTGLLISFLGTLPLGTLNTTAFQISASRNMEQALMFSLAVILIEVLVVIITLIGGNRINYSSKIFSFIMPLAITLLLYLSVSNFASANNVLANKPTSMLFPLIKSAFLLGLVLSTLNPMHIPFWMGWNSILIARKSLNNSPGMYTSYVTGISIGSFAGFLVFIILGNLILESYQRYSFIIAFAMGILYLGFATYLLYKYANRLLRFNLNNKLL
jgi:threonine/homoserine/homoserine lactone efflux protein